MIGNSDPRVGFLFKEAEYALFGSVAANELAVLSNISDISEDIHTYVLEEHEWISLRRRSSFRDRTPTSSKRGTLSPWD